MKKKVIDTVLISLLLIFGIKASADELNPILYTRNDSEKVVRANDVLPVANCATISESAKEIDAIKPKEENYWKILTLRFFDIRKMDITCQVILDEYLKQVVITDIALEMQEEFLKKNKEYAQLSAIVNEDAYLLQQKAAQRNGWNYEKKRLELNNAEYASHKLKFILNYFPEYNPQIVSYLSDKKWRIFEFKLRMRQLVIDNLSAFVKAAKFMRQTDDIGTIYQGVRLVGPQDLAYNSIMASVYNSAISKFTITARYKPTLAEVVNFVIKVENLCLFVSNGKLPEFRSPINFVKEKTGEAE